MKIKLFNVCFGESILLECENGNRSVPAYDGLLVDCGSIRRKCSEITDINTMLNGIKNGWPKKNESKPLKRTVRALNTALDRSGKSSLPEIKRLSGMLTHYHKDHYSLFPDLKGTPFDMFYLSNITFSKSDSINPDGQFGSRLTDEAILCYSYAAKAASSVEKENAVFFLAGQMKNLQTMVADGSVRLLSQGDCFSVGKQKFEVLWPPKLLPPDYFQKPEVSEALVKAMEELEERIRTFLEGDYGQFQEDINTIRDNMKSFYGKMAEGGEDGVKVSSWEQLGPLYESQVQALKSLGDIISKLPKDHDEYHDGTRKKYTSYVTWLSRISTIFKQDMNATSIVFRDSRAENNMSVVGDLSAVNVKLYQHCGRVPLSMEEVRWNYLLLMTGDITRYIIEKYLYKPYFKGQVYQFLKCPHHGTYRDHYSNLLPPCLNYLVSTGVGNKLYGKMAQAYYFHPIQGILANRCYSTNCDWCEIHDAADRIHGCCPMSRVKRNMAQAGPYIEVDLTRCSNNGIFFKGYISS